MQRHHSVRVPRRTPAVPLEMYAVLFEAQAVRVRAAIVGASGASIDELRRR